MSFSLDFSFLSQEAAAGAAAGTTAPVPQHAPPPAPSGEPSAQQAPLVLEVQAGGRGGAASLQQVTDSWTVWDCNRQAHGGGQLSADAASNHSGLPHTARAHDGSTSFTRAFAHMKQRPGYEPPKPAQQRPQGGVQGGQAAGSKTPNARAIQVSRRQTNNPVIKNIRNVPWEYAEIVPDYQMGSQTCCLYLSLRYHLLKPKYIYTRMEALQRGFRLRVLLCLVDAEDNTKTLIDIHKVTVVNGWTLILAWSPEEAARYLETYQVPLRERARERTRLYNIFIYNT